MIVVADSKLPLAEAAFGHLGEVRLLPTPQVTNRNIQDADMLLVRSETRVDAALLQGTHVRFVGTATIGTDHVDEGYLAAHHIGFASCPGSNANSVAEYVLAALLVISKRLVRPLRGSTIGIVGHGNTGSRVAAKARALGMNVRLNDPPLAKQTGDQQYTTLDALMDADYISLHVPLTERGEYPTKHLFNQDRLAAMKRGSVLINSSRGSVVDGKALTSVLREQWLQACALDVWENEPLIDPDLLSLVSIGTPHIAGYSYDGKLMATRMLQQSVAEYFQLSLPPFGEESAELSNIILPENIGDLETTLRHAVRQSYDIERDDAALRQTIQMPPTDRGALFRRLRAEYPVRREFHNYIVDGTLLDDETRAALSAVGFTMNDLEDAA